MNKIKIRKRRNKLAQVWIETVLYTLIGLALIGVALAFLTPKINQAKDKSVVEQTIASLNAYDEVIINTIDGGAGNRRVYDLTMKRGSLYINSSRDELDFVIDDLTAPYSQTGVEFPYGRLRVLSEKGQKNSKVLIRLVYAGTVNITYNGKDVDKKFTPSSVPYKFWVNNLGDKNGNGLEVIDIKENSEG